MSVSTDIVEEIRLHFDVDIGGVALNCVQYQSSHDIEMTTIRSIVWMTIGPWNHKKQNNSIPIWIFMNMELKEE